MSGPAKHPKAATAKPATPPPVPASGANGPALERQASSAEAAGMSRNPLVNALVQSCPYQKLQTTLLKMAEHHYERCTMRSLTIEMHGVGMDKTIVVAGPKTPEAVDPSVKVYEDLLKSYDYVIEALSVAPEDKADFAGKPIRGAARTPLRVRVTPSASAVHSSPEMAPHPAASIDGLSPPVQTVGGMSANGEFPLHQFSFFDRGTWGRMWPFGQHEASRYILDGTTCGCDPGGHPVWRLSAALLVMPDEKWTVTLGAAAEMGDGLAKEKNLGKVDDAHGVGVTRTRTSTRRNDSSSNAVTVYEDGTAKTVKTETRLVDIVTQYSGTRTTTTTTAPAVPDKVEKSPFKVDSKNIAQNIKVDWTIGGQTNSFEAKKLVENLKKIKEVIDKIQNMFTVKVGWSWSINYTLLSGGFNMSWGHRWGNYHEAHRVWLVERFVEVGGTLKVITASVEAMCGLQVESSIIDFHLIGKVAVEAKIDFTLDGKSKPLVWTTAEPLKLGRVGDRDDMIVSLTATGSLTLTPYGEAQCIMAGVGFDIKMGIEGKATLTGTGGVSMNDGLTCSVTAGAGPIDAFFTIEVPFMTRKKTIEARHSIMDSHTSSTKKLF